MTLMDTDKQGVGHGEAQGVQRGRGSNEGGRWRIESGPSGCVAVAVEEMVGMEALVGEFGNKVVEGA